MTLRLHNPMSAVVWLAFLVPLSLVAGWADRAFGAAVFVLACLVMISKPSPWEARRPSARALKLFLLLEFLYVVSALYAAGFSGNQIGPSGWFELLRFVFLGAFVVYLIRHYDVRVRESMEWAMLAALYAALLFPAADPQAYVSIMTLCWLLFFSALRLRFLHAATALLVVVLSGDPRSWTAAFWVLSAGLSVLLHRGLVRRGVRSAARLSLVVCALLWASPALFVRSSRAAAAPPASSATVARQFIRRSPVFGWGPIENAAILGRSQYLCWTLKGGALGAGLILAALFFAGYRLLRSASADAARFAGAAAFLGSVALMLTAGLFLESFRLFFVTSFFVAGMSESGR